MLQDRAAQHSTISYRAPELFDVASDAVLDTRTDVFSLGCLLYCCLYGYSPFECEFHNGMLRVREASCFLDARLALHGSVFLVSTCRLWSAQP